MKNNKKILTYILIIVAIALVLISFFVGSEDTNEKSNRIYEDAESIYNNAIKESETIDSSKQKDFTEINVDTYLDYYNGNENKIVLIARPTCSACQIAEPILKNIAYENDIELAYLNTDNFTEDDETNLIESNDYFSNGFGTPLLLVLKESSIINKVEGVTDKEHYLEFLKENGFIN